MVARWFTGPPRCFPGSYECGICGKKYKYYNCFQTHVRAHRDTEATSGEGASQSSEYFSHLSDNFRYTCDICGKKYKYYSCFQEHRDLHAVDGRGMGQDGDVPYRGPAFLCFLKGQVRPPHDARHDPKRSLWPGTNRASVCFFPPAAVASRLGTVFSVEGAPENRADPFDQGVVATDEVKEEPPEPFQKIGPKTGNYTCEFCGKQYKYYTPYQEHVALHAPISTAPGWEPPEDPDTGSECSHPEVTSSPRFVAAKTQTNQSGKKAPASVVRCTTLLHRTPPATQTQTFRTPNSGSPASKATAGMDGLHNPCLPDSLPTTCLSCSPCRNNTGGPTILWYRLGPMASGYW
ncbi:hypothetical protein U0070_012452 [Myodes glareolus]|uniref:C2H2-type domain-containing protein n=1 Tax=Myodes glareolus TaxID=447135 RepID=A0AAW0HPU9_MYOGA